MSFLKRARIIANFSEKKEKPNRLKQAGKLAKDLATATINAASLGTGVQLAVGKVPTPRFLVEAMRKGRFGKDIAKQAEKIKQVGVTKKGKPIYEALNLGNPATSTAGTRAALGITALGAGSSALLDKIKNRKKKSKNKNKED